MTSSIRSSALPPEALFAAGAVSQYGGAAIAVELFDSVDPAGVAWLRVLGAAAILVAWRRPWKRTWSRSELVWTAAFGAALGVMNLAFYLAIDELPLGNAVAIEFMGPIAVAAFGSRTRQAWIGLGLAVAGVLLLVDLQSSGSVKGAGFALLAGSCWAGYIVFGHRVAQNQTGLDGLGLGMVFGAGLISVFGARHLSDALDRPALLVLALATGLLSNVIPYAIDQLVLRRMDQYRFALLQAMLPASAILMGLIALGQVPGALDLVGVALVVAALSPPLRLTSSDE